MTEKVKDYAVFQAKSVASKVFYNHLNAALAEYKTNYPLKYKIGMQHIAARSIFQDINQLYNGKTMLHQAVEAKDYNLMKVLLFLGADSSVKNSSGVTAYEISLRYKEEFYRKLLLDYQELAKKKINTESQTKGQQYYVAMMHKMFEFNGSDKQAIQFIVDALESYQKRYYYFTKIFLFSIKKRFVGDFINIFDADMTMLQRCMYEKNIDLAQALLYFGADPMLKNHFGLSAFELAIQSKQIDFLKLFWPYVSSQEMRSEVYPILEPYKFEILEIAYADALETKNKYFLELLAQYFGVDLVKEDNQITKKLIDFWN